MEKISSTNRIIGFENRRIGGVTSPIRAAPRPANILRLTASGATPLTVIGTLLTVAASPTIAIATLLAAAASPITVIVTLLVVATSPTTVVVALHTNIVTLVAAIVALLAAIVALLAVIALPTTAIVTLLAAIVAFLTVIVTFLTNIVALLAAIVTLLTVGVAFLTVIVTPTIVRMTVLMLKTPQTMIFATFPMAGGQKATVWTAWGGTWPCAKMAGGKDPDKGGLGWTNAGRRGEIVCVDARPYLLSSPPGRGNARWTPPVLRMIVRPIQSRVFQEDGARCSFSLGRRPG